MGTKQQPPKLALRLFRWYCRRDRLEELEGDLIEFYQVRINAGQSVFKASLYCWWNVIRFYKPYAMSKTKSNTLMISLISSYFKLSLRHSWKNKVPVSINVIGLGLALSMCIFVYMLYAFNLEFDNIYKNTEDAYRINAVTLHNGEEKRNEYAPIALDDIIRQELGSVRQTSSFFTQRITVKKGTDFFSEGAGVVSTDFDQMFKIPLKYGSYKQFGEKAMVYLTQAVAIKYFGNMPALNEKLSLYLPGDKILEVTVGGVFDNIPLNSSFQFDILFNQKDYLNALKIEANDWSNGLFIGQYLTLDARNKTAVETKLNSYLSIQNQRYQKRKIKGFELIPFHEPMPKDMIIGARYVNARLKPSVLIVFSTLAMMTFLVACFNLANTSMALIAQRLKEIGVRKTLGSGNSRILFQFLFEMSLVSLLAFIIAISTANLVSTAIIGQLGASFLMQDVNLSGIILFIISFLLFTTITAGLLPALYAKRFKAIAIMRKSVKLKGISWLNKILTIGQYGLTIAVLVASITFYRNAVFLRDMKLGYEDEQIINLPLANEYFAEMQQEINQLPGVSTAGAANHFGNFGRYSERVSLQIDTVLHEVRFYAIDENYLDLMEINIVQGRSFKASTVGPEQNTILISETLAKEFFDSEEIINKEIKINGVSKTIVGITNDIIDDVVKAAQIMPTVIGLASADDLRHLIVRVNQGDPEEVESKLRSIWKKYIDKPYQGFRQEDFALGASGKENKLLFKIFLAIAILSGFLSIVGLFSLAKLNVTKRIKEISIRKVMGASPRLLLMDMNRSFLVILLIALIFGSSFGFFLSNTILDAIYRYHVQATIVTSLLGGLSIAIISMIMIAGVTLIPAHSNPVKGLKE